MEQELITTGSKELSVESKVQDKLIEHWIDLDYSLSKLKNITENATTMNAKWDVYEDYKTKLDWVKTILKLQWIKMSDNNINVAIFNHPKWNLKY